MLSTQRIIAKTVAFTLYMLHVKEDGDNTGEIVDELLKQAGGYPKLPWCVATVAFIYNATCKMLGLTKKIDVGLSSSKLVEKAERLHMVVSKDNSDEGDVVVFKGGETGFYHTAFVYKCNPDGSYWIIEGNAGNQVKKTLVEATKPAVFIKLFY